VVAVSCLRAFWTAILSLYFKSRGKLKRRTIVVDLLGALVTPLEPVTTVVDGRGVAVGSRVASVVAAAALDVVVVEVAIVVDVPAVVPVVIEIVVDEEVETVIAALLVVAVVEVAVVTIA